MLVYAAMVTTYNLCVGYNAIIFEQPRVKLGLIEHSRGRSPSFANRGFLYSVYIDCFTGGQRVVSSFFIRSRLGD